MFINAGTLMFILILIGMGVIALLVSKLGQERLFELTGSNDLRDLEPVAPASVVPELDYAGHVEAGNQLYYQYQYQAALDHYLAAAQINDTDKTLHFRMGKIFQALDDVRHAEASFLRMLQLQPTAVEALYELARLYYARDRHQQALKMLGKILAQDEDDTEALKLKARILIIRREFEPVIPTLQKLLRQDPDNLELKHLLAKALYYAKQYDQSLLHYETLKGKDPTDRRNVMFYIYLIHDIKGEHDIAIATLEAILANGTGTVAKSEIKNRLVRCYIRKALRHQEMTQYKDAITAYEKAAAVNPNYSEIFVGLGKLFMEQGDRQLAMTNYQKALELGSGDATMFFDLGILYDKLGQYQEALEFMRRAAALTPTPQVFYQLGTFYGLVGDMKNSVAYLQRATRLDPAYVDAYYNLGVALESNGNKNEALKCYKKVLTIDKTHKEALSNYEALRKKK